MYSCSSRCGVYHNYRHNGFSCLQSPLINIQSVFSPSFNTAEFSPHYGSFFLEYGVFFLPAYVYDKRIRANGHISSLLLCAYSPRWKYDIRTCVFEITRQQ